ncbi:MAG: exopolysaccharide biosynthesis polyprenyl glycosylphosphotransferase [Ferrovibrionaceae bacterium]
MRWTHGLVNRLVMAWDGGLLLAALACAWFFELHPQGPNPKGQAMILAVVGIHVFLSAMTMVDAYRLENYRKLLKQIFTIAFGIVAALAIALILVWAFAPNELANPGWLFQWAASSFVVLVLGRLVVGPLSSRARRRGLLRREVVIVGATDIARDVIRHVNDPGRRDLYRLAAVFDDRVTRHALDLGADIPVTGRIEALHAYVRDNKVDIIVMALPWEAADRIFQLLGQLQMIAADIVLPLKHNPLDLRLPHGGDLAGLPVLQLMQAPLRGTHALMKLIEDYVVATIGIIVAAPVIAIAAIAIRLDSPGPVFFRQPRLGLNNTIFPMFKLRTMTVDESDDGSLGTKRDNPRITRVGAFLRRTSLDELPQLLNVLRGEMSVVGPRAHVPNMVVSDGPYYEVVKRYATRSRIKPGITGWAQINGMRGGIDTIEKARRGVELDTYYVENWSLWFDFKIMLRTLVLGMVGRDVF